MKCWEITVNFTGPLFKVHLSGFISFDRCWSSFSMGDPSLNKFHITSLSCLFNSYTLSAMSRWIYVNLKTWLRSRITSWAKSPSSTFRSSLIFYSGAWGGNMEHNPQHGEGSTQLKLKLQRSTQIPPIVTV